MSDTKSVKERPILMNDAMVRATLRSIDPKSQTRRIPNHILGFGRGITEFGTSDTKGYDWHFRDKKLRWHDISHARLLECCPYGQRGGRLWVRERCVAKELDDEEAVDYAVHHGDPELPLFGLDGVLYPANEFFRPIENSVAASEKWLALNRYRGERGSVVPSIHMPRWASRILLEITGVRVNRVQDINEADAMAEGVEWRETAGLARFTPKKLFRQLWESIHGQDAWGRNDWVWVIEFKRVTP